MYICRKSNIIINSSLRSRCLLRFRSATVTSPGAQVVLCHHHRHQCHPTTESLCHRHRQTRTASILLFDRTYATKKNTRRPWHDSQFMRNSSPDDVEQWLLSLLQSARKNAHEVGISSTKSKNSPDDNILVYFHDIFDIDAMAFLRVLESYARSTCPGAPQKAEYWIGVHERHYAAATDLFITTFGKSIDSLAYADQLSLEPTFTSSANGTTIPNSTTKIDAQTLHHKRDMAAAIVRNLQPTVECYNSVIETWGNDTNIVSVVRSRRWLSKLEDEAKTTKMHSIIHSPMGPNARSYDLYLHSCSRGLGKNAKLHKERAEEAEEILHRRLLPDAPLAVRPTTESFNYVLRAWTRCRKDMSVAAKVMNLVLLAERIQKEYVLLADEKRRYINGEDWVWKRNIAPDTKSYTMALDAWIIKAGLTAENWRMKQLGIMNSNRQRREKYVPPTLATDESDGTKEMEKAETILKYIQDLDCVGHSDIRATVIGYNTLLSGYARISNELRPNMPFKSEKILHEMISLAEDGNMNVAPDVLSFNAVIKAWGRTKQANSAERCEFWLTKMIDANRSSMERGETKSIIPKPDVTTYNLCMDAHLQLGDASRVQDLLIEMDSTNGLITPNSESFSKVIRAWLNDELNQPQYGLPGSSLMQAWNWLNELLTRENQSEAAVLGPTPELFSTILKTAARTVSIVAFDHVLYHRLTFLFSIINTITCKRILVERIC